MSVLEVWLLSGSVHRSGGFVFLIRMMMMTRMTSRTRLRGLRLLDHALWLLL